MMRKRREAVLVLAILGLSVYAMAQVTDSPVFPGNKFPITGGTMKGNILVTPDSTYSIGATGSRWLGIYGDTMAGRTFRIDEGGASPTQFTYIQGGTQAANITLTLPTAQGAADSVLANNGSGTLSWAVLGGDVTGSVAATVVGNDSHAHTGTTLSGIDIGDDTNLTGTADQIVLTGDTLSFPATGIVTDSLLANGPTGTAIAAGRSTSFVISLEGRERVNGAEANSSAITAYPYSATTPALNLRGDSSKLFLAEDSSGTDHAWIDTANNTVAIKDRLYLYPFNGVVPFAIDQYSGSTADLMRVADKDGYYYLKMPSTGGLLVRAGTALAPAAQVGGVLKMSTTQVGNGAGTQTDAWAYAVPANTLGSNGSSLSFYAAGTFSATANTDKRVSIVLGSDAAGQIFNSGDLTSIVSAAADWVVSGTCVRTGTSGAKCISSLSSNFSGFAGVMDYTTITTGLTAARTFAIEVDGTGASDTIFEMGKLSWAPVGGG